MKSLHLNTRNNQSGMTLTEALLVLAVGALVAVLAYGGYKMATNDVKTQSQVKGVIALAGKVKQVYSTSANYLGVSTADVVSAKLVPSDFKINGATIDNSWGGKVELDGTASSSFYVRIKNVPSEGCIEFLAGIASGGTRLGYGAAGVTEALSTMIKDSGNAFNAGTAATACALPANANGDAILTVQ